VIEEYTPAGIITASYVYGDTLLSQARSGNTSFYLFDGHSGVRQLTNVTGAVTDTYLYDGYGNLLQRTGSTVNPYLYRGEQTDSNTGLQYLRARYYDLQSGRFLSTDPFEGWQENPVSRHRYLYGNNNPIMFIDPSGKTSLADLISGLTTQEILAGLAVTSIAIVSLITGGPDQDDKVSWRGAFNSVSGEIPGFSLSTGQGIYATGKSDELFMGETIGRIEGKWLLALAGISLPLPNTPPYGASRSSFDVTTDATIAEKLRGAALSGPASIAGFSDVIGAGPTGGGLIMGWGRGVAFDIYDWSVGVDVGISAVAGISIPIYWRKVPQ
jgi:RHS repeat-associated protein